MSGLVVDVRLQLERFELAVSFACDRPVTGLFGPSGAGKTSVLEVLAGLRRNAQGRVAFDGRPWLDSGTNGWLPPHRRGVGYVPQDALLFPQLDVRGNLLAGAGRARRNGHQPQRLLRAVCELLELTPLLERDVETLSGGERRRVAVGRALCSGPRLLLLDEPLASLDLPLRRRLLPLLRRLRSELTTPTLLVSHDPAEMLALCDEVVVLDRGRVTARGEPQKVLTDPAVFPLAAETGYENVLVGRLVEQRASTSRVRLDGAEVDLFAARIGGAVGEQVMIGLPAADIVLARERPPLLSARNVLPARVEAVQAEPDHWALVLARLAPGLPPLVVSVVETTPARLGLQPGSEVYLIFKATSCRAYAG